MGAANGLLEQLKEHAKHSDAQLKSIEHVTEHGLREVAESVKGVVGEIRGLRESLVVALIAQQREMQRASSRIVLLTLGTISSILVAVFVWITGVEPHLPGLYPPQKHEVPPNQTR